MTRSPRRSPGSAVGERPLTALDLLAPGDYRAAFPGAGPDELYELVCSDRVFRMPTPHLAQAQLTAGGRAHVCVLTWPAPGMGGVLGACHGLDVPLVFGNLDRGQPVALLGEVTAEAEDLSARMRSAWTSFAIHAIRAGRSSPRAWPRSSTPSRS